MTRATDSRMRSTASSSIRSSDRERYTSQYSASAEALTVLRQGTDIHGYMKAQPDTMKGASEWDRLAGSLGRLARAYGATFPLPPDAPVRRVNDKEAAAAADAAAKSADEFKKPLVATRLCRRHKGTR